MVRGWGRTEAGHPVPGLVVVLRRHGDDLSADDWRPAASLGLPGALAGAGVGGRKPLVSRSRNSKVAIATSIWRRLANTRAADKPWTESGVTHGSEQGRAPVCT